MNFRLDITRLCKHEFNKSSCANLVPLLRPVLTLHSFSYFSMLAEGTLLMLFLFSLGKPQFLVTDLKHCLKHLHLTLSEEQIVD